MSKSKTFRLSGADRVAFVLFNYQDKEMDSGITVRNDDDAKFIRSFVRRGFLRRVNQTWKFTRLGNAVFQKTKSEFYRRP